MQRHQWLIRMTMQITALFKTVRSGWDSSYPDFRRTPANLLLSHLAVIFRVLNAIIQPCKRANQSHTRTKSPCCHHSRAAACGSLPPPKQLHANLQCEMSIRLLISVEGSPLIHPKAVEVILSQSFWPFVPQHRRYTTLNTVTEFFECQMSDVDQKQLAWRYCPSLCTFPPALLAGCRPSCSICGSATTH